MKPFDKSPKPPSVPLFWESEKKKEKDKQEDEKNKALLRPGQWREPLGKCCWNKFIIKSYPRGDYNGTQSDFQMCSLRSYVGEQQSE